MSGHRCPFCGKRRHRFWPFPTSWDWSGGTWAAFVGACRRCSRRSHNQGEIDAACRRAHPDLLFIAPGVIPDWQRTPLWVRQAAAYRFATLFPKHRPSTEDQRITQIAAVVAREVAREQLREAGFRPQVVDPAGLRQPRRPPRRTRWTPPRENDPGPNAA